jgi:hypothetical protein
MSVYIRRKSIHIFVLIFMFSVFSYEGVAQFNIKASVVGSGGGVIEGSNLRIVSTLGQPFLGSTVSADMRLHAGLWFQYDIVTSVSQVTDERPSEYRLEQNYPNPFNPSTTIGFALRQQSSVLIEVYNVLGQKIVELMNDELPAGRYEVSFDACLLPSGVYIYRIKADDFVAVKRMILLK